MATPIRTYLKQKLIRHQRKHVLERLEKEHLITTRMILNDMNGVVETPAWRKMIWAREVHRLVISKREDAVNPTVDDVMNALFPQDNTNT